LVPVELVQTPRPLQTRPWTTSATQLEAPHDVPIAWSWQAPEPSHAPVRPQVEAASAEHSASGSRPARIGPQTPSAPAPFFSVVQATQGPLHAASQHVLSTQRPFWHSTFASQACPLGRGWRQTPLLQT
jgi:hypothetical protein